MKRQKKTFIFICMIFCFGLLFHQPVKAAQMELLPEQSGLLMEEESQSFPFYVPVKANVTIAFVGLNDDDDGTYGCYILGIRDIRNEYVFTQRGEIEYDNKKITTILEPGAYLRSILRRKKKTPSYNPLHSLTKLSNLLSAPYSLLYTYCLPSLYRKRSVLLFLP